MAGLFGKRLFPGARRNLPEIAVWISEVAEVTTPSCVFRRLHNLAAGALRFGQHFIAVQRPRSPMIGTRVAGTLR
ncbi:MAG TPA: hypothetical protein VI689_03740 [Acidimicrobiia bacterium]|nr:hypothetical protein [Acidimicrobiia bacterium]